MTVFAVAALFDDVLDVETAALSEMRENSSRPGSDAVSRQGRG